MSQEHQPQTQNSAPQSEGMLHESGFDGAGGNTQVSPPFQLQANEPPPSNDAPLQLMPTAWGEINPTITETRNGLDADLEFVPGDNVDATKIAFSQAVRTSISDTPRIIDPSQEDRMVDDGSSADGFRIDRLTTSNNPMYGTPSLPDGSELEDTTGSNSKYDIGYHYTDASGDHDKNAFMHDSPGHAAVNNSKMEFESAVLAIEGAQEDTYYGSIKWGWERDGSGDLSPLATEIASMGTPTNNFMAAAQAWNQTTARGTVVTRADDTNAYRWNAGSFEEDFQVDADTRVRRIHSIATPEGEYQKAAILNGPHLGEEPYFHVDSLRDEGDGRATIDLPLEDVHTVHREVTLNQGVPGPYRHDTTLPVGTRVRIEQDYYPFPGDFPEGSRVYIKVVDGEFTGDNGWVPSADLQDENTDIN